MCSAPVGGRDPVHRSSVDRGATASRGLLAAGFSRPGGMGGWARERCDAEAAVTGRPGTQIQ